MKITRRELRRLILQEAGMLNEQPDRGVGLESLGDREIPEIHINLEAGPNSNLVAVRINANDVVAWSGNSISELIAWIEENGDNVFRWECRDIRLYDASTKTTLEELRRVQKNLERLAK